MTINFFKQGDSSIADTHEMLLTLVSDDLGWSQCHWLAFKLTQLVAWLQLFL